MQHGARGDTDPPGRVIKKRCASPACRRGSPEVDASAQGCSGPALWPNGPRCNPELKITFPACRALHNLDSGEDSGGPTGAAVAAERDAFRRTGNSTLVGEADTHAKRSK